MKKLASILAAAALLAACGQSQDPEEKYRKALPGASSVQLGVPDSTSGVTGQLNRLTLDRPSRELGGQPLYQSEYAVMSYWTAVTVNVGVWWTLELVKVITSYPATDCNESACTWGPWLGDDGLNFWKFHAEKVGEAYDWQLSLQPANDSAAPWVDLIAGHAVPGVDKDHGSGTFTIDFDAQDGLQHADGWVKEDFGTLEITYDNTSGVSIQATLTGGHNDDPDKLDHIMNAVYDFNDTGAGGVLQFAVEDVTATENVSLRTRWNESGAGRADAHYNDPDAIGGAIDYFASQCWAGKAYFWAETYDTLPDPDQGTEANCVYPTASYSDLVLP